jgi:hypothetical protein
MEAKLKSSSLLVAVTGRGEEGPEIRDTQFVTCNSNRRSLLRCSEV